MTERKGAFAPFAQKMQDAGLPDVAIRAFKDAYDQLCSGATGLMRRDELSDVGELPAAEGLDEASREAGRAALGQAVVIKLNGGLGTSMGMTQAKSLLVVKDGLRFLDITARQMEALASRHGSQVPLVLMNSFRTRDDSLAALAGYPDLSAGFATDFLQHRIPRIRAADLTPVAFPESPQHEWCPPGHGDIYTALVTSGLLEALLAKGRRYAFVSNADNLGAVLDTALLGWFVGSGASFAMEVKRRGEADRKGGHLARTLDGRLTLREVAQCPEEELDEFQDIERYRFFNTNNLWIDLQALQELLAARDSVLGLPLIRNEKPVDPEDAASERVYQLETAMGAAISEFPGARAIVVASDRFAPVKTTNDLLRIWSDAYELSDDFRVVPASGSAGDRLFVELDGAHFKRVPDLEARIPEGPPSLVACRSLTVRGDVRFGRGVKVRGAVEIEAAPGERVEIADGTTLGEVS
ncbi:MAG: UTP--glucose-1-phosphate uridylyltransferase [Myxococcota bacterium]